MSEVTEEVRIKKLYGIDSLYSTKRIQMGTGRGFQELKTTPLYSAISNQEICGEFRSIRHLSMVGWPSPPYIGGVFKGTLVPTGGTSEL